MDSLTKKFEDTLQSFIAKVQHKLEDHQATLHEYEKFFKKFEEVFPNYSSFATHAIDSIHKLEELENQLAQKIAGEAAKDAEWARKVAEAQAHAEAATAATAAAAAATATASAMSSAKAESSSASSESKAESKAETNHDSTSESRPRPAAKAPRPAIKVVPNAAPKAMLIVDDAEINRVLMGHYFKSLPVKLEFSGSGADAVEKCQNKKFDLILMDLQMKEMSGLEATQKIRTFEAKCPIFAITNNEPTDAELQESIGAGCTRYLSRALTKEALIDQVSEQLFGV